MKIEVCPHCSAHNDFNQNDDSLTMTCTNCGKTIALCTKCEANHENMKLECENCALCDLVNVMNCVRNGKRDEDIEKVLGALVPPLTDMTTGLPESVTPSYEDYMMDTEDEQFAKDAEGILRCVSEAKVRYPDAQWDVKYWDCFRLIKESFLDETSNERDYFEIVEKLRSKNAE